MKKQVAAIVLAASLIVPTQVAAEWFWFPEGFDPVGPSLYDKEQDSRISFNNIMVRNMDREMARNQYEAQEFWEYVGRRHDDLNAGISMAMAQGQHVFDPNYDRLQLSIAGATYESEGAGSLALGGRVTTGSFLSLSVGKDSQQNTGFAGSLSFRF